MIASIDKEKLFEEVIQYLESNLAVLVESAFAAKEASTNEEAKAENKYDTRGLEASYLASGQAKRAKDLQEQIFQLKKVNIKSYSPDDSISVSALVELSINEDKSRIVFLLPVGGVELTYEGHKIQTLTLDAPLGNQLYGLYEGDDFQMGANQYEIVQVK